jgi:polyferredoxin
MILVFRHFFYRSYVGLGLWPFIILRNKSLKEDKALINHERIHLRQQAELLLVFFYLLYLLEWIVKSLYYMDFYRAYRNISFEREAYLQEKDLQYLQSRKPYQGLKYLFVDPMQA